MAGPRYVILDFETTGLDPRSSEILEIGALQVEGLEVQKRYHQLIKPQGPIPAVVSQITGITAETVADAPALEEVLPGFLEFLGGLPIVAHNANLEQAFLDHFVTPAAHGLIFSTHNSIEPFALLLPDHPSHSLESLRKWAGIVTENAHRADQDCEDLLSVLRHAREWMRLERPEITRIVTEMLGNRAGAAPEGRWWWLWFFSFEEDELSQALELRSESSLETNPLSVVFEREPLGDLKDLRSQDSSREIDWEKEVPAEEVHRALNQELERFKYRQSQDQMAQQVRQALTQGQRVAIEAPTGTGKSVAYLLPGVLAAEASGAPLVISTHSKALQDQLLEKDIPTVRTLLQKPALKATTVKGQENYLCLRKLHDFMLSLEEDAPLEERFSVTYLLCLAAVTRAAELDRVSYYLQTQFKSLPQILERVRSHHTTTVGPSCPFYKSCHFYNSARLAHVSNVVIANHALVFQWPMHLPQIRNIVFDEAHHLEDQITEAYSVRMKEQELADNLDRLSRRAGGKRVGDQVAISRLLGNLHLPAPWNDVHPAEHLADGIEKIRTRMNELRAVVPLAVVGEGRNEGYEDLIDLAGLRGPAAAPLLAALQNLQAAIKDVRDFLAAGVAAADSKTSRSDPSFDTLTTQAHRFDSYEQKLRALIDPEAKNFIRLLYWNARESVWRLQVAPISVAELTEPFFAAKRAMVLTSATLTHGSAASFVTDRIGLKLSRPLLSLPSPYRLAEQASIYIPSDVAQPGTPSHLEALVDFAAQTARVMAGRTLLLMTSNRRLAFAAEVLRERLKPQGITVYDSLSDRRAAESFRETERALLIGSERYGEGLDIPGKALSCVIIEKINEAMTRGPLPEARRARTRFGLYDYDFPLRMMWLKQRVGRLIRSPSDMGSIVVFDPRYNGWSASSRGIVQKALAPIPIQVGTREWILSQIETHWIPE